MVSKIIFHVMLLCSITSFSFSQQTMGLFRNSPEAMNGYTLFAPLADKTTYLIDNCGQMVHSWESEYTSGLSVYLLENGLLYRSGRVLGAQEGVLEIIDCDGNVLWSYSTTPTHGRQHHDIEILPNGNIMFIVWDNRTPAELQENAGNTSLSVIYSEQIIEVEPDLVGGGATVVWEWKAWDHIIQDDDSSKNNYGVVSAHPERIDINYKTHNTSDWLHINGLDYNEELDQIILSVHALSELWIIDHSTSTQEAAGSSGGNSGKGGDLLYRWGNPQVYQQGTTQDQKLFKQHHTHWIKEGYNDGGKIMLFNNQAGTLDGLNYSSVDIIIPPIDNAGNYLYQGGPYTPQDFDWRYQSSPKTAFYSQVISGAERLPNGNTLVCEGVGGRFFEIDDRDSIVWEYINQVGNNGPMLQGETIAGVFNNVFRCIKYSTDSPAFAGKDLSPKGNIEIGSTHTCEIFEELSPTGFATLYKTKLSVYPNPSHDFIYLELDDLLGAQEVSDVRLVNSIGKACYRQEDYTETIDVSKLKSGLYFLNVNIGGVFYNTPVVIGF